MSNSLKEEDINLATFRFFSKFRAQGGSGFSVIILLVDPILIIEDECELFKARYKERFRSTLGR